MNVKAYLSFEGRCDEALAFYKQALGAEVSMLMRFKDSPDTSMCAPGSLEKVMHAEFRVGDTALMASDGQCQGTSGFKGINLALTVADAAEAEKKFGALSQGGQVQMPLTKTFFSESFGMVADKFGVVWMVMAGK